MPHAFVDTMANNADYVRLLDRVKGLPGVQYASLVASVPFGKKLGWSFDAPDVDRTKTKEAWYCFPVTDEYFRTLGVQLVRGRAFDPSDGADAAGVVVINQALAQFLWPDQDAVGKVVQFRRDRVSAQIIGIAKDSHIGSLTNESRVHSLQFYLPLSQYLHWHAQSGAISGLLVRTDGKAYGSSDLAKSLRSLSDAAYISVRSLDDFVEPFRLPWKLGALMFGLLGVLAFLVAAIGLYSQLSFMARQRTQEIGIRMAMGASIGDIWGLVIRESLSLVTFGIGAGLIAAIALARLIQDLLFGITATDAASFLIVGVLLGAVSLAASIVPALRACRVPPMTALREL
jgi:hypothetical protein